MTRRRSHGSTTRNSSQRWRHSSRNSNVAKAVRRRLTALLRHLPMNRLLLVASVVETMMMQ